MSVLGNIELILILNIDCTKPTGLTICFRTKYCLKRKFQALKFFSFQGVPGDPGLPGKEGAKGEKVSFFFHGVVSFLLRHFK